MAEAPVAVVRALADALGIADATAQVMVRRGIVEPDAARRWLAADVSHNPALIVGMDAAVTLILRHVQAGSQLAVHGDYDVDGVTSTTILVQALQSLGTNPRAILPRRSDGYGLSIDTIDRLHGLGTQLLITCDCGVTAVEEVAHARAIGIDVVVTDHHQPRADGLLPDAPLVHPALGGYPCPELCAAGVAHKLACALRIAAGVNGVEAEAAATTELDLVALATIADCVPLVDENRRLVREGLRQLSRTERVGLRALMRVADVDAASLDEQSVGFRLSPRLNAAGRMDRADVALDLLVTDDRERATVIADELHRLNGERRHTEQRILFEAEAQVREMGERPAYVLWGEGWHRGVIGIVASRLAEQHHRPVLLLAVDGALAVGSGRSIPGFDLLAGLEACSASLTRFGGHRAAAGCEAAADALTDFRAAFERHADAVLRPEDLASRARVDAVVDANALGLGLAEELSRLGPFGQGNPSVSLLVPAARLEDQRPLGSEGKHMRCTVRSGGARAAAVAFGMASLPDGMTDVVASLEAHSWRGTVEPRLAIRHVVLRLPGRIDVCGEPATVWEAFDRERETAGVVDDVDPSRADAPVGGAVDRRGDGIAAVLAALVASGDGPVVVISADANARAKALSTISDGLAVWSHQGIADHGQADLQAAHVVIVDPPVTTAEHRRLCALARDRSVVLAWGSAELTFALNRHEREYNLRALLGALYRDLRASDGAAGEGLEAVLRGPADARRSVRAVARCLLVLAELDLVSLDEGPQTVMLTHAPRTELERSSAFRAYTQQYEAGRQWQITAMTTAA